MTCETLGSSISTAKQLLELPKDTKKVPTLLRVNLDVRDVARAHVRSISNPEFDNTRSVLIDSIADGQLIADILHKNRPTEATNLVVGTPGVYNTTADLQHDCSKTNACLGFEFILFEKTILDQFDDVLQLKKESKQK